MKITPTPLNYRIIQASMFIMLTGNLSLFRRLLETYPLSHDDLFCMLLVGYELDSKTCASRRDELFQNLELSNAAKQ